MAKSYHPSWRASRCRRYATQSHVDGRWVVKLLLPLCMSCFLFAADVQKSSGAATVVSNCPQGQALPDGCNGAQSRGTIVNANLANPQSVIALNIIGGSGYTNGTFSWTSSGGGCSSNASGTITVTGEAIRNQTSSYTISSGGSGCTSRPTISIPAGATGGRGGRITPTVYQLTPHNASPKWNVPGVDYPVGHDTTLTLSDPTVGRLPCGSFSGSTVTIASGTCTLNGYDFSLHNTHLVIAGGTVTISNSKFACISNSLDEINVSGTGSTIIKYNTFNGGASAGVACAPGGQNAAISINNTAGSITIEYNYCFNQDSKCIIVSNGGTNGSPLAITERYNYWYDMGICGGSCSHGEAEYYYPGVSSGKYVSWTMEFNVMLADFNMSSSSNLTAPAALEADGGILSSPISQYNYVLAQGNQAYTGSRNANGQVASAALFCGHQEGGSVIGSPVMQNNILDYSGAFFPYNSTSGTCRIDFTAIADFNAGTSRSCNITRCN